MATDLASLAIAIDSTEVPKGVAELDRLTAAGTKAEAAVDGLARETKVAGAELRTASQAASDMANKALASAKATTNAGESTRIAAHHAQNLAFQFNDIAVSLASGQKPMTVLFQQGAQIAQIMGQAQIGVGGLLAEVGSLAARFAPAIIVAGLLAGAVGLITSEINENSKVHVTWKDVVLGTYDAVLAKLKSLADGGFAYLGTTSGAVFKDMVGIAKWSANAMIGSLVLVPNLVTTAFRVIPGAIADVFVSGANMAIRAMNGLIKSAVELINDYINKANSLLAAVSKYVPGMGGMQIPTMSAPQIGELKNNYAGAGKQAATALIGAVKDTLSRDYVGAIADYISPFAQARARKRMDDDAKDAGGHAGKSGGGAMGKALKDELGEWLDQLDTEIAGWVIKTGQEFGKVFQAQQDARNAAFATRVNGDAGAHIDVPMLNDAADAMKRLRDSATDLDLASVFGDVGSSIQEAAKQMEALTKAQENYAIAALDPALRDGAMAKLKNQEFNTTIGLIGASKKLFDQQSTGYKVITAFEKAFAAIKLVNTIKAMVMDTAHTATSVANSTARATADTGAGAAKMFSFLGPFAFPVVAAMLALLVGLGVKTGGGGGAPSVPSAEDIQKATGTGTVLGDPTAKSNSIANSLAIVADNTNKDLEYSNSMLVALRSIDSGISKLSGSVAKQIQVAGGMFDTTGANLGQSGSAGFLGLFSSSTTRELWDLGLQLNSGSVAQILQNGVTGQTYQIIQQIKKSSGFLGIGGGTKTTYQTTTGQIDPTITDAINGVIYSLRQGLLEGAKVIGLDGAAALIDNFRIEIGQLSFKDMTGDEIEKQLNAVFSKVGDQMAGAILPALTGMQKIGEGLFETFMRVAREYQVVDVSLKSIGKTFGATGVASLGARDALVQMFESLDAFVSQTDFYRQNFLTDAERIAPVISSVADEMIRLGLASVDSLDGFKAVVNSLDLTTTAGQQTYAALMAVAPAFSSVIKYQDKLAKSYDDQATSLRSYLSDLLGKGSASSLAAAAATFRGTAAGALAGDLDALGALKGVSNNFLDAAKQNAKSPLDYARARAEVLRTVSQAATVADIEAEIQRKQLAVAEGMAADVTAMRAEQAQINADMSNSLKALNNKLATVTDGDALKVTSGTDQTFTVDVAA